MSDAKKQYPDPLVRQRLFPEPDHIFGFAPTGLKEALTDGIVVVDTNVLLVPYQTGRASLEQIRRTYETLSTQGRLRIPGQVAREFADHRAEKLKILFQQLSRKRSISLERSEYPLLEEIVGYADVVRRETDIAGALVEYRKALEDLLNTVAGWQWDDPVSRIYRDLFKPSAVVDLPIDREELLKELKYRQEHRVPPGYKDSSNEYSGVGDLVIWKTILQIGNETQKHLIFVSGDEKTDWRYQSEGQALYPRFELLDEYRRASNGRSLLIISFSELLKECGVPAPIVAEVREEEVAALSLSTSANKRVHSFRDLRARRSVSKWLFAQYPGSYLQHNVDGFPMFIVKTESGPQGYEVKHVRQSEALHRRIRELRHRIGEYQQSTQTPINVVLVVDEASGGSDRIDSIVQSISKIRLSPSMPHIIIGVVSRASVFEERYRKAFEKGPSGETDY